MWEKQNILGTGLDCEFLVDQDNGWNQGLGDVGSWSTGDRGEFLMVSWPQYSSLGHNIPIFNLIRRNKTTILDFHDIICAQGEIQNLPFVKENNVLFVLGTEEK